MSTIKAVIPFKSLFEIGWISSIEEGNPVRKFPLNVNSLPLFKESMYEHLNDFPYPNSIKNLKILGSELNHPGILGAAALCY